MSGSKLLPESLHKLRQEYFHSLQLFASSSKNFHILDTIADKNPSSAAPGVLYVLDSSFNPPTLAHLRIAGSALSQYRDDSCARLLLLLATQNADKPSRPALFEDRLIMMNLFAQDIRTSLMQSQEEANDNNNAKLRTPAVDIGVTKLPYFIDKAAAISHSNVYPDGLEQVHLTGFDTLIRIFNPKYYPPEHTLQPLAPFLSQHRLRVTLRPDDEWGGREEQTSFLRCLALGEMERNGGEREWADRIELVEGKRPDEEVVSSTKARESLRGDTDLLDQLVTPGVRDWLVSQRPYGDE